MGCRHQQISGLSPYNRIQQESPPAWTQEAYRPPCSEYSFCCPTRVPPRGVPDPGTPPGGSGYPPGGGTWPGYPPRCLMAFWEMLQSIMGYGYPPLWTDRWMDGRTDACQNITFPRTTYAGGNKFAKVWNREFTGFRSPNATKISLWIISLWNIYLCFISV